MDLSDLYKLKSLHVTVKPYASFESPNGIIYDPRAVLDSGDKDLRKRYDSFFSESPMDDTVYATVALNTRKTAGEMLTNLVADYREVGMFSLGPFLAEFHLSTVDFGASVRILGRIKAARSGYVESEEWDKLRKRRHIDVHVSSRKQSL